jgi:hypothetical protein
MISRMEKQKYKVRAANINDKSDVSRTKLQEDNNGVMHGLCFHRHMEYTTGH